MAERILQTICAVGFQMRENGEEIVIAIYTSIYLKPIIEPFKNPLFRMNLFYLFLVILCPIPFNIFLLLIQLSHIS